MVRNLIYQKTVLFFWLIKQSNTSTKIFMTIIKDVIFYSRGVFYLFRIKKTVHPKVNGFTSALTKDSI